MIQTFNFKDENGNIVRTLDLDITYKFDQLVDYYSKPGIIHSEPIQWDTNEIINLIFEDDGWYLCICSVNDNQILKTDLTNYS